MREVCLSPESRRNIEESYASWLSGVPWQLFCTFTFAWKVSDPQAARVFRAFIDRLEKFLRGPVAFVRGDEKRFSGCGMPGSPRHFHAVLTAHRGIDRHYVHDLWTKLAGRRANGAGADVRIYDPSLRGIDYILKLKDQTYGDWTFGNLDLVLPGHHPVDLNRRQRRRLARHQRRIALVRGGTTTLQGSRSGTYE